MQLSEAELKALINDAAKAAVDEAIKRIYVETGKSVIHTVAKWFAAAVLAVTVYLAATKGAPAWKP